MSFKFSRNDNSSQSQNYHLNYKAGQYAIVDLGTKEDPEGPVRSFTLASSPTEDDFILISTRIRDTPFKKKLESLGVGHVVNVIAPIGKFILHSDHSKPAVFLSGGIGVTPFSSMVKYATDRQVPVNITIFDSNRNQNNILYKEEFDEWANTNKNLKIIYTLAGGEAGETKIAQPSSSQYQPQSNPNILDDTDWRGERGFINKAMLTRHLKKSELENSIFYICGPPGMLKAMQKLLEAELHIPKERMMLEEFTGY